MRTPRPTSTALLSLAVCAASLLLSSAPALAAKTRFTLPFSPFGAMPADSHSLGGVAVDQPTGNVFMVENSLVRVYGPEGGPPIGGIPSQLVGTGTPQGAFDLGAQDYPAVDNACYDREHEPGGHPLTQSECEALDPSNGDIYVPTYVPGTEITVVDKFRVNAKKEYEYVCQFTGYTTAGGVECSKNTLGKEVTQAVELGGVNGAAVDREGNVYITNLQSGTIYEFDPAGEAVAAIKSLLASRPITVAVDSHGDIYTTSLFGSNIDEQVLVELKRSSFTGVVESEVEVASNTYAVAVDQATGRLSTLVSLFTKEIYYNSFGANEVLVEEDTVTEYDPEGKVEITGLKVPASHEIGKSEPAMDLAINETSNDLYVVTQYTTYNNGNSQFYIPIEVFGAPVNELFVMTEGSSGVQAESAVVGGSLNPEGEAADLRFEYGPSPSLGSSVAALPGVVSGSASVPAEASLTGLEPNLTYSYRFVGTGVESKSSFDGVVHTFKTSAVKPLPSVRPAMFVGPREAVLVGAVNPENSDTHYRFVFGTTTGYGASIPREEADIGSSFGNHPVTNDVAGLQPGTTYHYAVVASDSQGSVQSGDMSFTTPAPPVPVVVTGGAGEVAQNSAVVTGSVDPEGVSTGYEFDLGTDTSYGARVFGEVGSGSEPQAVSLSVDGLQPGTTYHYRVAASNAYGTVYGADQTFTTPGFPSSSIAAPLAAPLVATPVFSPPSTAGAVFVTAPKAKAKKAKAKKKARAKRQAKPREKSLKGRSGKAKKSSGRSGS
jgi:hypothetical protein